MHGFNRGIHTCKRLFRRHRRAAASCYSGSVRQTWPTQRRLLPTNEDRRVNASACSPRCTDSLVELSAGNARRPNEGPCRELATALPTGKSRGWAEIFLCSLCRNRTSCLLHDPPVRAVPPCYLSHGRMQRIGIYGPTKTCLLPSLGFRGHGSKYPLNKICR